MTDFEHADPFTERERLEFLERVMKFQDGTLPPEGIAQLSEEMLSSPAKKKLFLQTQIRTATLHDLLRIDAYRRSSPLLDSSGADEHRTSGESGKVSERLYAPHQRDRAQRLVRLGIGPGLAALVLIVIGLLWNRQGDQMPIAETPQEEESSRQVIIVGEDRSSFFGNATLTVGDVVVPDREYMLQSGLIQLQFPSGAMAIIKSPAIFHVETEECLAINTGGCSVHAPPGAEGFEVITPMTKVVDRGTRFYVNVEESSETQVHVIEGAADLFLAQPLSKKVSQPNSENSKFEAEHIRLAGGEAMRLGGIKDPYGERLNFRPEPYLAQLPDRIVDYQASSTEAGTAEDLLSVTVQRGGQQYLYQADELIPIEVTWYQTNVTPEPNGSLCGFREKPNRPQDFLEDRNLSTGLINFGGQVPLLTHRPVMNSGADGTEPGTPGLGIRFRRPVVNHPGPDVILFEIQPFSKQLEGDPFHVYPMSDRQDLHPHTVTDYHLTMESPSSRIVNPLWSHRYKTPIRSLDHLQGLDADLIINVAHMHFRVIGVGIDLSNLGYAEGEEVEELFFQSCSADGMTKVDPVFIGGLPPLTR